MNSVWALKPILSFYFLAPYIYLITKKTPRTLDIFSLALLITAAFLFQQYTAFKYLFVFYIGFLLPKWNNYLKTVVKKNKLKTNFLGIICLFLLFNIRVLFLKNEILTKFLEALLISALIFLTINNKRFFINRAAKNKVLLFYGKISYSFYLISFLVLYAISWLFLSLSNQFYLNSQLSPLFLNLSLGFLSLIISTPTAYLLYRFIEKKSFQLGSIFY